MKFLFDLKLNHFATIVDKNLKKSCAKKRVFVRPSEGRNPTYIVSLTVFRRMRWIIENV